MKFTACTLALVFGAAIAMAQDAAVPRPDSPVVQTQNAPAPSDEVITIPAKSAGKTAAAARAEVAPKDEATTVTMWKLVQDGGWAMVPLGFLSVVTVMLVLVYLFTLRRSSILTAHYMNTADVLLKKRDYLGLLAISSRHSEAVARVVQIFTRRTA